MTKDTISAIEAARRLGVSLNFFYDLVRVGKVEARKMGKQWLVSAKAVEERLARLGKAPPTHRIRLDSGVTRT